MIREEPGHEAVLDASALIAVLNPSDPCHDDALSTLDDLADCDWLMHPLTHVELLVGPARADGERGVQELEEWLGRFGVRVADDVGEVDQRRWDVRRSLALLRAASGVKLPDVVVLQLALARGGVLVTSDRRLARTALDHGIEVEELRASR